MGCVAAIRRRPQRSSDSRPDAFSSRQPVSAPDQVRRHALRSKTLRTRQSAMPLHDILGGFLTGGAGGIASGFLGITSGGILVPLLVLLLGQEQHVAQGVSLVVQVVPTSLSGVRSYQRGGHRVPLRWV